MVRFAGGCTLYREGDVVRVGGDVAKFGWMRREM